MTTNDQTYPVRQNQNLLAQIIEALDAQGNLVIGGYVTQGNLSAASQTAAAGVAAGMGIPAQGPITQEFTLAAADIKALRATPMQLVPAPGAGKYIKVLGADLKLVYNANAYTNVNANLKLFHGTTANAKALTADLDAILLLTADSDTLDIPILSVSGAKALMENVGIFAGNDGSAEFLAGDSPLKIVITYLVVTP